MDTDQTSGAHTGVTDIAANQELPINAELLWFIRQLIKQRANGRRSIC